MDTNMSDKAVLAPDAEPTGDFLDKGRRYRFEHLALPLVLNDMSFNKDDPGPGDAVPDFDLLTLGGGRFRSTDLGETGPALLIEKNDTPASPATARPNKVLPVPGGPISSTPLGILAPSLANF